MSEDPSPPRRSRGPRSDARRSIERITAAGERLLDRHGPGVTLEEVAREAGVAPATLYRHFPSRMHLFEHIHRGHVARLASSATELMATREPFDALTHWLRDFVALGLEVRGVLTSLLAQGLRESDPKANAEWGFGVLVEAAGALLDRAQQAHTVRPDIGTIDLVTLISGVIRAVEAAPMTESPDVRQKRADLLLLVIIDGLAATSGTSRPPAPRRTPRR
ncbi:TetR/AcrR family transcriptional regulator [Dactylosporangium sp. CA-092794]|uniref:TetR/AcrR family transcriptional regulator n=1 Tax=Dactylosporangium sp. CA-092794 TaxID=3239929 RepID=UPI003D8CE57E